MNDRPDDLAAHSGTGLAGNGHSAAERLAAVRDAIARAAREEGRDPDDVTLIAVSKTFGPEAIRPLLEAGQRVFGENRVQEAKEKWPALKRDFPDVRLHLIGPLQTNKVRDAVTLFDAIHALDRPSLAKELAREFARERDGRGGAPLPDLFIQINTGEEPQKAGVTPQLADSFIRECREEHGLEIRGLMCIPPVDEPPSPHFALLRRIAGRNGIKALSMGMSGDFEQAVMLGATHVRVGSALFGARPRAG
ncbi:YggS family pyridoxal phosphate-dependent enzyme [Pseudochelatococcus sp. B33]